MARAIGREVWQIACFFAGAMEGACRRPPRRAALSREILLAGRRTAGAALILASIAGALLVFTRSGAGAEIGPRVSLALIRGLAPALAALALAARAGAAVTAELAALRASGRIDALEADAVDARQLLAAPRVLTLLVAAPLTSAFVGLAGIVSAYLLAVLALGLDGATFMDRTRDAVGWLDLSVGLAKAAAFGVVVASLSTYRGFRGQEPARALAETTLLVGSLHVLLSALRLG